MIEIIVGRGFDSSAVERPDVGSENAKSGDE
jgi:hypothetical protein